MPFQHFSVALRALRSSVLKKRTARSSSQLRSPADRRRSPSGRCAVGAGALAAQLVERREPGRQHALQQSARRALDQHLHALDIGDLGHRQSAPAGRSSRRPPSWMRRAVRRPAQPPRAGRLRPPRPTARVGAQQRQVRERRQAGAAALGELAGGKCVRSRGAAAPRRADASHSRSGSTSRCPRHASALRPARPAACISSANRRSGARKSLLNSALSGLTAATSVTRRKSCPLAIICVPISTSTSPAWTAPSRASSCPRRRVLSASMRAMRTACRTAAGQRRGNLLLQPLGAAPDRRDVEVAALRAGARHPLGEAAVMAAQGAVELVEDPPGAAVRAAAAPAAVVALQHRRIATPIEEQQALLAARDALAHRGRAGAATAPRPPACFGSCCMSTSRTVGSAAPPIRLGIDSRR